MRTAIILSGHMRSFEKCWPNLWWSVFRHFPGASMYVCTQPDEDAKKAELVRQRFPDAKIRIKEQPEMLLPPGCPEEWNPGAHYMHEPYAISVSPAAVVGQLWMLREGWRLYQEEGEPADVIIRCRPDLWFLSFEKPAIWARSFDGPPKDLMPFLEWKDRSCAASTPWWGRFGGVNDRFAIMGHEAADSYFRTYDRLDTLIAAGAPMHPESLVHASLRMGGCSICDDLLAEFATLRKDGNMRPPEISGLDIAHLRRS